MRAWSGWLAAAGVAFATSACDGPTGFTATAFGTPGETATITGTVTADGSGMGGVGVVVQAARRDSTVTAGDGSYRFDGLPSGQFTVSVRVPLGFQVAAGQEATQTLSLASGGTAVADFALQRTPGAAGP